MPKTASGLVQLISASGATLAKLGGGLVVLPLLVAELSREELGFYYLVQSAVQLLLLFELGMSSQLVRHFSNAFAGAAELSPVGLSIATSQVPNRRLLSELLQKSQSLYIGVAIAGSLAGILYLSFLHYLSQSAISIPAVFCGYGIIASAALGIISLPSMSLVNGTGHVAKAHFVQMAATIVGVIVCAGMLLLQMGLWSVVCGNLLSNGILFVAGRTLSRRVGQIDGPTSTTGFSVIKVLGRNTRDAGVMLLGSYLITNSPLWFLAPSYGLAEVAGYGVLNQVLGFMASIAAVPIVTAIPRFVQLRTTRLHQDLYQLFFVRAASCMAIIVGSSAVFCIAGPAILTAVGVNNPLPALPVVGFACIMRILEVNQLSHAHFVMSDNIVPFYFPAILSGIGVLLLSSVAVPRFGIGGVLASQFCVQSLCNYWYPIYLAMQRAPVNGPILLRSPLGMVQAIIRH